MIHRNYAEEEIPNMDSLIQKSLTTIEVLNSQKKFRFNELFTIQTNGKYHRNEEVLKQIGFNNKSSKNSKKTTK